MFRKHSYDSHKKPSFTKRLFRSGMSTVIISAFVLSVTYGVKFLSEKNPQLALYEYARTVPQDSKAGQVAGVLTEKYENYVQHAQDKASKAVEESSTGSIPNEDMNVVDPTKNDTVSTNTPEIDSKTNDERFVVAIFADSHSDTDNLNKAISVAKSLNTDVILHLGDHTNLGIVPDLQKAKNTLELSGIKYYALPGDRDLWESTGPQNFIEVFGTNRHSFKLGEFKFVLLDNSRNFSRIPQEDVDWFSKEVTDASFVLLSQPLYHPSNKVMGIYDGEKIVAVRNQAEEILEMIRQSNVKAIISAEHHLSSETLDPIKPELVHYVVGAVTSEINDKPQAILQTSRISILELDSNGTFKIHEELL